MSRVILCDAMEIVGNFIVLSRGPRTFMRDTKTLGTNAWILIPLYEGLVNYTVLVCVKHKFVEVIRWQICLCAALHIAGMSARKDSVFLSLWMRLYKHLRLPNVNY